MYEVGDPLPRVLWLYIYAQYGCEACAMAKPEIAKLKAKYPLKIIVVELHIDQREWTELLNWAPKYTPGYALVERDGESKRLLKKATGVMDLKHLENWIGLENLT